MSACVSPRRIFTAKGDFFVPCGFCLACRMRRASEWSFRLYHELDYWSSSSFITLTYDEQHLPKYGSLSKSDITKFWKRLRKQSGRKVKYYFCGEYGEKHGRPHYHAILFGIGLTDPEKNLIQSCWLLGSVYFGSVTSKSIGYVCQYISKKYHADLAVEVYRSKNLKLPFQYCSQGLGLRFALDNKERIDKNLYLTLHGVKRTIPRYYIKKLGIDTERLKSLIEADEVILAKEYEKIYGPLNNSELKQLFSRLRKQSIAELTSRLEIANSKRKL